MRKSKFPLSRFRVEVANALTASQPASVQIGPISHSSLSVRQVDCKPLFNVKKVFFLKRAGQKANPKRRFKIKEDDIFEDNVAVVEKMDSTWFNLVVPFEPKQAGLAVDETGNDLQLTSDLNTAYCRVYQVGSKEIRPWNTSLLTTFQVEVWKKFWKLSPPKVSIFRVCLRTL